MKPADLVTLLQGVYHDKLGLYRRHQAGARHVSSYEFNNTYQYILNREDAHLMWLRAAVEDVGGVVSDTPVDLAVPAGGTDRAAAILEDDARTARAFVDRWRQAVSTVTHGRHRKMLDLLLGETTEQQRFFELAVTGRTDLLGRRPDGAGTGGGVLPTRWVE